MLKPFHILDWRLGLKRRLTPRPEKPSGVLLTSFGGLGDTVLFARVLPRFLALAHEGEETTVLLRSDGAKTAFVFPPHVRVKTVDFTRLRRDLGYRRDQHEEIFNENYRLALATDFLRHPYLDEALFAAAQAQETAAMEPRPWRKYDAALKRNRRLYGRLFNSGPVRCDKIVRWSRFANWLTGENAPPPKALIPRDRLPEPAALDAPTLLIQPFSAVKAKQCRPELYASILESLPEGIQTVITGAPGDLGRNPDFKALVNRPNVRFDSSTFEEIAPLLRAARLVVSVDTAMMHLAVALGAPTLCLASAAYVGEIVPYDEAVTPENAHFLYLSMNCEGCLGDCTHPLEKGMFPCLAALDANAAVNKVRELLANTPGSTP